MVKLHNIPIRHVKLAKKIIYFINFFEMLTLKGKNWLYGGSRDEKCLHSTRI